MAEQNEPSHPLPEAAASAGLQRSLTLPLVTLYGLGVTIGAGIYVLVGATAGVAGMFAPMSFLLAALVMLPSACSFAELVGRLPVSAGEAAYVRHGLGSNVLAAITGLLVVTVGTVSAAAICVGSVGYVQYFLALPDAVLIVCIVFLMAVVAAWGIMESVTFAALFTIIEIGGLIAIIGSGLVNEATSFSDLHRLVPGTFDAVAWSAVFSAGLLAFFAFVGFEDLVNVAEETKSPAKTLPRAIFLTLGIATALYMLVAAIAVLSVPVEELAAAKAPLTLVFDRVTSAPPAIITAIAIVATLNGVIVQIIMASRVIYGMARLRNLPEVLGTVNPMTRTPLRATALVAALVLLLALLFPLQGLAIMTSRITLVIFTLVNLALFQIKRSGEPAPANAFVVAGWVPVLGIVSCVVLLLGEHL